MKIHFYSPNRIEPWDYRNVFDIGIGGSETSHVEMAGRLAARGHEVTSYTDLPADCPDRSFGNVTWKHLDEADLSESGLWIIYRKPSVGLQLTPAADRRYWLVCQDVFYPDWSPKAVEPFERIIGLCPRHLEDIRSRDPSVGERLCLSSNGINVKRIEEAEHPKLVPYINKGYPPLLHLGTIVRNPTRLIWTSSPDRGLKETLDIFERAREQVSHLELHIFYGMDNIEKICGGDRKRRPWSESWKQYDRANAMPGVTWRGRVGQQQLTRELFSAGIWLYPTWFPETSCISCMEAQACGCIPITNPIWATGYNVKHGIMVEGQPNDPLVKARYVEAVVSVALNPKAQEQVRVSMMRESRKRLSWERFADQWNDWLYVANDDQPERAASQPAWSNGTEVLCALG